MTSDEIILELDREMRKWRDKAHELEDQCKELIARITKGGERGRCSQQPTPLSPTPLV